MPEVQRLLRQSRIEDLRRFVAGRHLLVLDEAQRVESIGLALKILHEHFPKTKILVTRSSSFELGKSVKEPLTGRKREFPLYPVSLAELATQHDFTALRELLPRLLRWGSYPEAITSADPTDIFRAFLKHDRHVEMVTFWGPNDANSWRANGKPLLFDGNSQPKPAFQAVIAEAEKAGATP